MAKRRYIRYLCDRTLISSPQQQLNTEIGFRKGETDAANQIVLYHNDELAGVFVDVGQLENVSPLMSLNSLFRTILQTINLKLPYNSELLNFNVSVVSLWAWSSTLK